MAMIDVTPGAQHKVILQGIMGAVVHVSIGYLIGMIVSDHIYADLSRTEWNNLWVYFWLFFWPFGLFWMFAFYCLIGAFFLGGLLWLVRTLGLFR